MTATLPVSELEAQIHALSYEDKLRIACFAQREVESDLGAEPAEWIRDELALREQREVEGINQSLPWEVARERLSNRYRR